jgi:hypothetical protein
MDAHLGAVEDQLTLIEVLHKKCQFPSLLLRTCRLSYESDWRRKTVTHLFVGTVRNTVVKTSNFLRCSRLDRDIREIAIIARAKKVAILGIITSNRKRYSYFAKKRKRHFVSTLVDSVVL